MWSTDQPPTNYLSVYVLLNNCLSVLSTVFVRIVIHLGESEIGRYSSRLEPYT